MNNVQKNEEKSLEHTKKRSRPSLLRPVSAPAKVTVLVCVGLTAHDGSGLEADCGLVEKDAHWPGTRSPALLT